MAEETPEAKPKDAPAAPAQPPVQKKMPAIHITLGIILIIIVAIIVVVRLGLLSGSLKLPAGSSSLKTTTSILSNASNTPTTSIQSNSSKTGVLSPNVTGAISQISYGDKNFAINSYRVLSNQTGNESYNVFFSPFSVYTAISMLAEGAQGQTLQQMQKALGLPSSQQDTNLGFQDLYTHLSSSNGSVLSIADSLWIDKGFPANQSFVDNLSTYYYANVQQYDFGANPSGATSKINNWVANKTNGKITGLLPNGSITAVTRAVLVNAVYFDGIWRYQFNSTDTQNATFFVSPSNAVLAPLMTQEANVSYYSSNQLQAIELDYSGGNTTMLILLPTQTYGLKAIEANLTASKITSIENNLSVRKVDIWVPRFNMTMSEEMTPLLASLGMGSLFSPITADLSGISSSSGLYVSHVYHKAFISVNESGTVAAAATGVLVVQSAICASCQTTPQFRADHPFLYLIIDKNSGTVLFMGREANPTMSG